MKKKIIIFALISVSVIFTFLVINKKETSKELPLSVISTIPKNNAVFVNEKSEIVIILNRVITNIEGNDLKVEILPKTPNKIVYLENKIRISPETDFGINIEYKISISYKENLIYTLNFKTNPFTKEQIQEEGNKQLEGDLAFSESYDKFLVDFPWYRKIPIETKDYVIIYDFELKSFRIIMNRKITDETERIAITKKALEELSKIGVKTPIKNYLIQEVNSNSL